MNLSSHPFSKNRYVLGKPECRLMQGPLKKPLHMGTIVVQHDLPGMAARLLQRPLSFGYARG